MTALISTLGAVGSLWGLFVLPAAVFAVAIGVLLGLSSSVQLAPLFFIALLIPTAGTVSVSLLQSTLSLDSRCNNAARVCSALVAALAVLYLIDTNSFVVLLQAWAGAPASHVLSTTVVIQLLSRLALAVTTVALVLGALGAIIEIVAGLALRVTRPYQNFPIGALRSLLVVALVAGALDLIVNQFQRVILGIFHG